jgi:hypothetical protein
MQFSPTSLPTPELKSTNISMWYLESIQYTLQFLIKIYPLYHHFYPQVRHAHSNIIIQTISYIVLYTTSYLCVLFVQIEILNGLEM